LGFHSYNRVVGFGGYMGNPNPTKQEYRCEICGEPRPPYQFYCDKHLAEGLAEERRHGERVPLLDRFMNRLLGFGRNRPR
jgi:hypothetical protein